MRFLILFVAAAFSFAQTRNIAVISHRGEHLSHPENTMAAYQAAIDLGVDYIEVDLQATSDGKLVLMHDSEVRRTTNGSGKIAEMTFAQVRALDAGIKKGEQFRGTRVPTFEEALNLAHRRKTGIYVDTKHASAAEILAPIKKYKMQDHVLIYSGMSLLKQMQALSPRVKVMPEARSVAAVQKLIEGLHPKVIAFAAFDFTDEIIAIVKQAGAGIYVDRLGSADNPASWQNAIDRGATGIQTDHVAELLQYLRAKGYHR